MLPELTMVRGSTSVSTLHLRLDDRFLVLPRWSHPLDPLHGQCNRPDRPHHLELRDLCRSLHLWLVQDLLYVSPDSRFRREVEADVSSGAQGGFGGYLYGATSTMFVGGLAAAAAFGLVKLLDVRE
jgi:hypothetical protein